MKTKKGLTVSDERSELRDRIIEAAERKFLSSGFVRVTADDLAHELGMSKRTMYSVFRSKDEILMAVVRRMTASMLEKISRGLDDPTLNFAEKFALLAAALGKRLASISPVFLDDVRRSAPEAWRYIDEFRREKIMKYGRGLFESGRREGYFREDVDLDLVLKMFIELVQHFISPEAVLSSGLPAGEVMSTIFSVFFGGVLTGKGRKAMGSITCLARRAGEVNK